MRAGHEDLDSALDRELRAALRVDPSPSLAARVRTEIASQEPSAAWGFRWMFGAGLIAIAVVLAVAASVTRRTDERVASNPAPATTSPRIARPNAIAPAAPAADVKSESVAPVRRVSPPRTDEGVVQFSEADIRGFRQLVRLANQEDPDLAGLLTEGPLTSAAERTIAELQIPPVIIEALEPEPAPEPDTF